MRTSTPLLALGLILFAGACSANSLVGQVTPLKGWIEESGSCLGNDCDYNIGVLKKGNEQVMYFGQESDNQTNPPSWLILDQMPYPVTPANFAVLYGECQLNGKPDPSIIAVVKTTDTEWFESIRFAYKANTTTEQFETISIKGIRCENTGYGI